MTANVYEGMFLLDAGRYARDTAGAIKAIEDLIGKQGGSILVSRLWEERRLAYPINGQRKGVYWLTYFTMEGGNVAKLNRQTKISDWVLRYLVLKLHPKLADTIVSHASGQAEEPTPSSDDDSPGADAPAKPEPVGAATE